MRRTLALAGLVLAAPGAFGAEALPPNTYRSTDGATVPVPHAPTPDPGRTAVCRDSTESESHHARGTCSNHGGVERWK